MSSLNYWVWLSSLSGITPKTAGLLLEHFGTPENIYNASDSDFLLLDNMDKRKVLPDRKTFKDVEKIIKK